MTVVEYGGILFIRLNPLQDVVVRPTLVVFILSVTVGVSRYIILVVIESRKCFKFASKSAKYHFKKELHVMLNNFTVVESF